MDANLEVLKKIFDIKRKEQEIKKTDLELKSICKENCDLKAELSNTTSQIVEHKKTIESLEKENAKLAITKEIVTKEVEILENELKEITAELNRKKNEHKTSFMAFQNGNVDFSKEALLFLNKDTSDLTNTVEELESAELAKENSKAKFCDWKN
ncbi:hypothetical protein WA026_012042 [Henosepilachna vigintioctopunctata]|uniref:Uncharacterized protein n=1 Tax=Henosepilachna vigintioctopunctata TaxID=420089 RepID=A0AAW1VES0_9CUCU